MEITITGKVVIYSWKFNQLRHNYGMSAVTRLFANTRVCTQSDKICTCWHFSEMLTGSTCRLRHEVCSSPKFIILTLCITTKGQEYSRSKPKVVEPCGCSDLKCFKCLIAEKKRKFLQQCWTDHCVSFCALKMLIYFKPLVVLFDEFYSCINHPKAIALWLICS